MRFLLCLLVSHSKTYVNSEKNFGAGRRSTVGVGFVILEDYIVWCGGLLLPQTAHTAHLLTRTRKCLMCCRARQGREILAGVGAFKAFWGFIQIKQP